MQDSKKLLSTQNMIKMAFLSVIAAILMQWGIKLPALFPSFLEIDFSEMPALVAILAIHPWAGIIVVIVKNVLKALLFGTSTGYVGEFANIIIAIGYIFPLSLIARKHTHMKYVSLGIVLGIASLTITGAVMNYFVMLPLYAKIFMPMETIIAMGNAILPSIHDKSTLVMFSIVPFNLVKGTLVAIASIAFIKAIEPALKYFMPHKGI